MSSPKERLTALNEARGVLFDLDGTLIDSNHLHAEAWAKALRHFGLATNAAQVQPFIGKGGDKVLAEGFGIDHQSDLGRSIEAERGRLLVHEFAPRVKSLPKAKQLLAELKRRRIPYALATSAKRVELNALLAASGLKGCFELIACADDAARSKPDPDIVTAGLAKLGLAATDAVMFGDTPYDIEAAAKAGLAVIAFRSGGWPDVALKGAVALFDGPEQLLSLWASAPNLRRRETGNMLNI